MKSKLVQPKVRFAPSPTGFLHIGGARTALFNWLFARHLGGIFVLRIEDTDQARSEDRFRDEILESLTWLGLNWDEGPLYQSHRFDLYREYAEKLTQQGLAQKREGAVVFKIPEQTVRIHDVVYGDLEFDNSLLGELVILKSDQTPTYNFSCVIDDALMGITHIIRGDDHISNTPKQVALYQALGFELPIFAHVPMILGSDGKRLSKRHGATAVTQYREAGFLAEAIVNFLSLLGWSPGEDREMMGIQELIDLFSLERVNKKAAIFDMDKFTWMNTQYIKNLDLNRFKKEVEPFLKTAGFLNTNHDIPSSLIDLFKDRIKTLSDFPKETSYFFVEKLERDAQAVEKFLIPEEKKELLKKLKEKLTELSSFDIQTLEAEIRLLAQALGVKAGDLIHPARVALTGKTVSPGIFEVMNILGKEKVLKRLEEAIQIKN